MMRHKFLATILFLFIGLVGLAQEMVYWNYDISHGLPTNSLYHILIDKKERIWFGSDKGVTCYDGTTFRTFTTKDGLTDNTVIRCYEDSKGRIWFHHVSQLPSYYYKGKINKISDNKKKIIVIEQSNLAENSKGHVFFGTTNGFIEIDNNDKVTLHNGTESNSFYRSIYSEGDKIIHYSASNVKRGSDNHEFINIDRFIDYLGNIKTVDPNLDASALLRSPGLIKYMYKTGDTRAISAIEVHQQDLDKIYHIVKKKEYYYYCTSNGIFQFKEEGSGMVFVHQYFSKTPIVSVAFDSEDNMWATSLNSGLFFKSNQNYHFTPLPGSNRLLKLKIFDGEIYTAGDYDKIFQFGDQHKLHVSPLTSVLVKSDQMIDFYITANSVLCITYNGISCENRNTNEVKRQIPGEGLNIFQDSRYADQFILTALSKTYLVNGVKMESTIDLNLFKDVGRIRKVVNYQDYLIAATQKGVFKQIKEKTMPFFPEIFGKSRINGLINLNGTLIIGTAEKGVWVYSKKKLRQFSVKSGLLSNSIKETFIGENGKIWVNSNIGLQCFELKNGTLHELSRIDLKTTLKIDEIVDLVELKNEVYILTTSGIYILPVTFHKKKKNLHFALENLQINGRIVNAKKNDLSPKENNLFFEMVSVNHSQHDVVYYYRINQGKWIVNSSKNYSFSSLSPDDYEFEFKAESPFYETAYLKGPTFTIQNYWWKTPIALATLFFITILSVALILRWRILKTQDRKRRSLSIELFSLQSQMNPHFTFNSLNSIQSYLSMNDKRSAQIYLADFAVLMRNIMEQAKLNLITLEEEIEFLKQYLHLEKRRLDDSFSYEFIMGQEIIPNTIYMPTLMLQPFVENAIWHGVAALDYRGEVTISFQKNGENLICEIKDNGLGLHQTKKNKPYHKSTGINNVKERMRLFEELFNKKMEIEIIDNSQNNISGVCVRLVVPKLTLENKLS